MKIVLNKFIAWQPSAQYDLLSMNDGVLWCAHFEWPRVREATKTKQKDSSSIRQPVAHFPRAIANQTTIDADNSR